MRPITISIPVLESAGFFDTREGEESDTQARDGWINAMKRIAARDGVTLNFSNEAAMHAFIVDLDDGEYRYDTPEDEWCDQASDLALVEALAVGAAPNA